MLFLAPTEDGARQLELLGEVLRRGSDAATYARRGRLVDRDWRHLDELGGRLPFS